jgi:preprotein translocase subunit YajC
MDSAILRPETAAGGVFRPRTKPHAALANGRAIPRLRAHFYKSMQHLAAATSFALMPPPANGDPNASKQQSIMSVGMIVLMFVFFWVLVLRPQQKRAKEQTERLKTLKSGDRVTTSSGLVGTALTVKDSTVTIRCGDAKLEVLKSTVTEVVSGDASANQ